MDKQTIKAEAIKALESVTGYSYNNAALDAAIESGVPDGAVFADQDDYEAVRIGDKAVTRNRKTGEVVQEMPFAGEAADAAAIMYATRMAKISTGTMVR